MDILENLPIKYRLIYEELCQKITSGEYKPGGKLPTEAQLSKTHKVSRPTVAKALKELKNTGLIYRVKGSGSYVTESRSSQISLCFMVRNDAFAVESHFYPSIFNYMVPFVSKYAGINGMSLTLANCASSRPEDITRELIRHCDDIIQQRVKGVFFLPFEGSNQQVNQLVAERLEAADIRIVLLDRDLVEEFGQRSKYDIIGIGNIGAAYRLTRHLLDHGCGKIIFLSDNIRSSVVQDRLYGYQKALTERKMREYHHNVTFTNLSDTEAQEELRRLDGDALVCVNDTLACHILKICSQLKLAVPGKIKVAGFDDLSPAAHTHPPLTTIRQPVNFLAEEAVRAMITRINAPEMPARDILLRGDLIIRQSCGCRT